MKKALELENVHYKYERFTSLIGILQMFTAEIVEIAGAPANCLNDALFEIELEMQENNEQFKNLIWKNGGRYIHEKQIYVAGGERSASGGQTFL